MGNPSIAALVLALTLRRRLLRAEDASQPSTSASPSPSAVPITSPAPPTITSKNSGVVRLSDLTAFPRPASRLERGQTGRRNKQSGGFPITTASRVYVKGTSDNAPTSTLSIIDSANNQQFQDATKAMWNATSKTPEGYDKTVTVSGLPGFEHFSNTDKTGALWWLSPAGFSFKSRHRAICFGPENLA